MNKYELEHHQEKKYLLTPEVFQDHKIPFLTAHPHEVMLQEFEGRAAIKECALFNFHCLSRKP